MFGLVCEMLGEWGKGRRMGHDSVKPIGLPREMMMQFDIFVFQDRMT